VRLKDIVPADVGHRVAWGSRELTNDAWDDAEAPHATVLVASVVEELQPEADAKEGAVGLHTGRCSWFCHPGRRGLWWC
jgi:hypothetical protein